MSVCVLATCSPQAPIETAHVVTIDNMWREQWYDHLVVFIVVVAVVVVTVVDVVAAVGVMSP